MVDTNTLAISPVPNRNLGEVRIDVPKILGPERLRALNRHVADPGMFI
ncbi:MAG: hypothetical protein QGG84_06745 [Rhodospirillales bacterium]|nr:hypothetical protein [Rhodospirillales bacterium]